MLIYFSSIVKQAIVMLIKEYEIWKSTNEYIAQ